MRFVAYAAASTVAATFAIQYAWATRLQFYKAVVFLTTNKFAVLALGNMGLVLTLLAGRLAKLAFLGTLRDVELEILYENSRFAITETCLALTIFREELSPRIFAVFTALLFIKAFHWLAQARVEHVEQSDSQPVGAHVRLVGLMMLLATVDVVSLLLAMHAYVSADKTGPSMLIIFAFEFAALTVLIASTGARYVLHLVDMRVEGTWHGKNSCVFFVEFLTEALQFFIYVVFFVVVTFNFGNPLHIIRDLWGSYATLRRRLRAYHRYRQLTANMNERFADATPEELAACESTCIICRDTMDRGKRLPCGHIFHFQCLRMWLQQQQTCPTCRAEIPADAPLAAAAAAAAARATPGAPAAGAAAAAAAATAAGAAGAAAGAAAPAAAAPGGQAAGEGVSEAVAAYEAARAAAARADAIARQQGLLAGAGAQAAAAPFPDGLRRRRGLGEPLRRFGAGSGDDASGHANAAAAAGAGAGAEGAAYRSRYEAQEARLRAAMARAGYRSDMGRSGPEAAGWPLHGYNPAAPNAAAAEAAAAAAAARAAAASAAAAAGSQAGMAGSGSSSGGVQPGAAAAAAAPARAPPAVWARSPIEAVQICQAGGVEAREEPDPTAPVVRTLPQGTHVLVFERRLAPTGIWCLRIPGGWIDEFAPNGTLAAAPAGVPEPTFTEASQAIDEGFPRGFGGAAGGLFGAGSIPQAQQPPQQQHMGERVQQLEREGAVLRRRVSEVTGKLETLQRRFEAFERAGGDGGDSGGGGSSGISGTGGSGSGACAAPAATSVAADAANNDSDYAAGAALDEVNDNGRRDHEQAFGTGAPPTGPWDTEGED